MSEREVTDELLRFLREEILAPTVAIEPETLLASVGVDSMSLVQLLLFVERRFGFPVPDALLTKDNLATASALARCVCTLAANKPEVT